MHARTPLMPEMNSSTSSIQKNKNMPFCLSKGKRTACKPVECILIFDGKQFTLEPLHSAVTGLNMKNSKQRTTLETPLGESTDKLYAPTVVSTHSTTALGLSKAVPLSRTVTQTPAPAPVPRVSIAQKTPKPSAPIVPPKSVEKSEEDVEMESESESDSEDELEAAIVSNTHVREDPVVNATTTPTPAPTSAPVSEASQQSGSEESEESGSEESESGESGSESESDSESGESESEESESASDSD